MSRIHIPSPCTEDWGAMTGDAQRRFCDQCDKHVHDLSAMNKAEAERVIASPGVCVRARLDESGEVIHTSNGRINAFTRLLTLSAALLGATPALAAPQASIPEAERQEQAGPGLMDWVREQIRAVIESEEEVISQGEVIMGDIAIEPPPPPPPPPPPQIMGRIARPIPIIELPAPPPAAPLPRPEPGESVIPEVEEVLRNQR